MNYPLNTKKQPEQSRSSAKKFAKNNDLGRIQWTIIDSHVSGISNKSRAVLSFMAAMAKLEYTGIFSPIGALHNAISRSTGYSMSERSLYRALAELESHGFFHRTKYRVGANRFETHINFNIDAFTYWTQRRTSTVTPIPTQSHINSQLTKRQKEERTRNNLRVNSRKDNIYNKPRARAGKFSSSRYSKWMHPILYTLWLLVKGPDRRFVLGRAQVELEVGDQMAGHSGVPWNAWPRWQEMDKTARENIARREIIPRLVDRSTLKSPSGSFSLADIVGETQADPECDIGQRLYPPSQSPPATETDHDGPEDPPISEDELRAAIAFFAEKAKPEKPKLPKNRKTIEKISLNDADLRMLEQARARARALNVAV